MRIRLALCCLLAAAPAWTATPSYLSDNLTAIDATKWATTGSIVASRNGLTAPDAAGGSIIARAAAPDGSADGEIRMKIAIAASGGAYTAFLRGSADAKAGGAGAGTYLAFEMQNPTLTPDGACRANFSVFQSVSGSVSLLAAFPHACRNGMEMRMAARGDTLLVWPDQETPLEFAVDRMPQRIAAGQPGVGLRGTPAGNAISEVKLASAGRSAPAVLDRQKVHVAAFPNHIDLQWPAPAAVAGNADHLGYWIYRDGQYLGRTAAPRYQDETVVAGATYNYVIRAVDQHFNFSPPMTVSAAAPPWPAAVKPVFPPATIPKGPRPRAIRAASGPTNGMAPSWDPVQVGVQATGAYWGAAGENIDLLSGNLNFSLPLLTVKSRGGWSVGFRLSYNSQVWRGHVDGRGDVTDEWLLGQDVGYGFGWKLLAGAVTPIWSSGQIAYYLFTDATGAEYRLDQNNGNVWMSRRGIYLAFNANNNRLQFPDGTFWVMGCQSSGGEPDAGTLYPTTMNDTNGNYIVITYAWGSGAGGPNSSARIATIQDPRNPWPGMLTFSFAYTAGRLTSISNFVNTAEKYTFTYLGGQTLVSPFLSASFGAATFLQSVGTTGLGIATNFSYNSYGEMTQMTTPLGGAIQWAYVPQAYGGSGIAIRHVQSRYMPIYPGGGYYFLREDTAIDSYFPRFTQVSDLAGTTGAKLWSFGTAPTGDFAVPTAQIEMTPSSTDDYQAREFTWATDAAGNVYQSGVATYLSPVSPPSGRAQLSWPRTMTTQIVDTRGNLVQQQVYDYGSATPTRTYNFSYLTDANYTARHIYNRLTHATVNTGSGPVSLVANVYDQWATSAQINSQLHDDANYGTSLIYRGNVNRRETGSGTSTYYYAMTGVVTIASENGVSVGNTTSANTAYSLPETLTPNGNSNLATSIGYNGSWAATSVTGANGANANTSYDSFGRPASSKMADGAITNYSYTYNPNTQTATLGSRWTRTTLDGFGRPTKVETGHGSTTVSVAETEYAPCGCTPLGKVKQTARPHAPGGTPQWTIYTYDGMGRTTAVKLPDNSTTTTAYLGNSVRTTDAAGKWKTHTTDAFGNLVQVREPNPAGGADWTTTYQYTAVNQLTRVEMPRPYNGGTYTQVRTFSYGWRVAWPQFAGPASWMTSETNPETGTITYERDLSTGRLLSRINVRNQKKEYVYDQYGRVIEHRYHYWRNEGWWQWIEDEKQRVYFRYDTNPIDSGYTQNGWGRVAAVEFRSLRTGIPEDFSYQYSYNQAGRVTNQRMRFTSKPNQQGNRTTHDFDASYAWDNEGRMTSLTGPSNGQVETFSYDAMGRLSAGGATYGAAGELLTFNGVTRTYNSLGQLTRMTKAGVMDMQYIYTDGANNGRITRSKDWVTGEDVGYEYDEVNRLKRAETADNAWGNAYTYDGWGNLTGKTVTKGTAPTLSVNYNPATNLPVGTNLPGQESYPVDWDGEERPLRGKAHVYTNVVETWGPGDLTYDHTNKRVFWSGSIQKEDWSILNGCEITFYAITGKKLARYKCEYGPNNEEGDGGNFGLWLADRTKHVGGQVTVWNGAVDYITGQVTNGAATTDRLGSLRARDGERYTYFPYGEARTATVQGGGVYAGLENPVRLYDSGKGRFDRPDPLGLGAVKLGDPGSWNRFAYVQGDPVNFTDRYGLHIDEWDPWDWEVFNCINQRWFDPSCINEPPEGRSGGGGAGGSGGSRQGDGTVTSVLNVARNATVDSAFAAIRSAFANNPDSDCAKWFDAAFMTGENKTYGSLDKYLENVSSVAAAGTFVGGTANAIANSPLTPGNPIVFNLNGAFFKGLPSNMSLAPSNDFKAQFDAIRGGTDRARAFILLHEVGHLLGMIRSGDGGADATSQANQRFNNDQIWRNCNGIIASFAN